MQHIKIGFKFLTKKFVFAMICFVFFHKHCDTMKNLNNNVMKKKKEKLSDRPRITGFCPFHKVSSETFGELLCFN